MEHVHTHTHTQPITYYILVARITKATLLFRATHMPHPLNRGYHVYDAVYNRMIIILKVSPNRTNSLMSLVTRLVL